MAKTQCKGRRRKTRSKETETIPRYSADGRTKRFSELLIWRSGGLKLTSSTSTTSPRLTSSVTRLTAKEIVMNTWSSWEVTTQILKQDHCGKEKITKQQQVLWCAFNKNKAKVCLMFRCTWGQDSTTQWILPNNSARTGRRTSRHRLHRLTLVKSSTVARVATRRMAKTKVVGKWWAKTTDDSCSHQHQETNVGFVAQVALSSHISLQSCSFISHAAFCKQISRPDNSECRECDWVRVQITPHRTHACALFLVACHISHISSNAPASAQDVWAILCVSPKSCHPHTVSLLGVLEFSAFPPVLSSSTTPPNGDWNQMKPLCSSALGWTVWPSGRSDSKVLHRRRQRPYADQPSDQKERLPVGEWRDNRRLGGFWHSLTFRSTKQKPALGSKHCSNLVEIRFTGSGQRNCCFKSFRAFRGRRDGDLNVVQTLPFEENSQLRKDYPKLKQKWRS